MNEKAAGRGSSAGISIVAACRWQGAGGRGAGGKGQGARGRGAGGKGRSIYHNI